jgi:hypothetical protein
MEITLSGVKVIDIESFVTTENEEKLSIYHVGPYYDRVYSK